MVEVKISEYSEKTVPIGADEFEIIDSAEATAALKNKRLSLSNLIKGLLTGSLTAKTTPVANDEVMIGDSAASGIAKKSTLTQLDTALRGLTGVESGATADQTGGEIKTAYEAQADTNAFTDAEKTKLAGIASGAEVNTVDSVFGVGGDVDINSLTNEPSPGGTESIAVQTAGGAFRRVEIQNLPAGGGGGSLNNIVEDLTPQLGGALDVNGQIITSNAGGDVVVTPDTGGIVDVNSDVDITGNLIISGTVDGRDVSVDGTKLDGVEALADVTDAANVDAAGAVMESDFNANTILAANADNTPNPVTVAEARILGRATGGNIAALTAEETRNVIDGLVYINAETINFTFALGDEKKWNTINSATPVTATIPPNSSVAFPVNTIIALEQIGAGAATWTPGAGVTLEKQPLLTLVTNGIRSLSFARKTATDIWAIYGGLVPLNPIESWEFAMSDETTDLTTGVKLSWRTPYAIDLEDVKADVVDAPTGAAIIVDIHAGESGGTTIMTTDKISIDATELSSRDAATPPALTTTTLAANTLLSFAIDQIGSTLAGKGLKVSLIGRKAIV